MRIVPTGEAVFVEQATNTQIAVDADELDFEATSGSEEPMGTQHLYTATVERQVNGKWVEIEWEVSEYPEGAFSHVQTRTPKELTLVSDLDISFEAEPEDPTD